MVPGDLVGKIGVLLSSGKRYIIRAVILKTEEGDTSMVDVAFERPFGGQWEKYPHRLPIQTLRENSASNPFDGLNEGGINVHATADDGKDKLNGQGAGPGAPQPWATASAAMQYAGGDSEW